MSGILDNKSRIIDAILTSEGRRQMADGNFVVKFVTFSDSSVFYQKDINEGHEDPTNKIYLECFNLPQDQIVFESDDSGNLVPFKQHEFIGSNSSTGSLTSSLQWINFYQGKLKQNTKKYGINLSVTSSYAEESIKDINFASQIEGILTSSFDNFTKLRIIGTQDRLFGDREFALSNNQITFEITPNEETLQMQNATSINSIDALFSDEKLRNVENFLYLPPIKKTNDISVDKTNVGLLESQNLFLGDYPAWGPIERLTYSDIKQELEKYESTSKTIFFDPTSKDNALIAQMFEISTDKVSKLDVIDYGKVSDNLSNPYADTHHVFFIGKILIDDMGSTNFIHLFTLIFESDEENNVQAY
jgi:hypothetical protein